MVLGKTLKNERDKKQLAVFCFIKTTSNWETRKNHP